MELYYKGWYQVARMRKICIGFFVILFAGFSLANSDKYFVNYIANSAKPLLQSKDIKPILDKAGEKKLVLLGESSHGTAEFYDWRLELTKRLISEKKFSFVTLEAGWPSIYRLNAYVKGNSDYQSAKEILMQFGQWPQWMWKNEKIQNLVEWLKQHNHALPLDQKVGIYGMDVDEHNDALFDLLNFAKAHLPKYHSFIKEKLHCFTEQEHQNWEKQIANSDFTCRSNLDQVNKLVNALLADDTGQFSEKHLWAIQNALVLKDAEEYHRLRYVSEKDFWNSRVRHMWLSIQRLLEFYGQNSKGIVWAHNTHVGDSSMTTMHQEGIFNIGYVSRKMLGIDRVFILGFGTNTGKVSAASARKSKMLQMQMPPARDRSIENLLSRLALDRFYLLFNQQDRANPVVRQFRQHRAIGVLYKPEDESLNYTLSSLPWRYDGFIFIEKTNPIDELN